MLFVCLLKTGAGLLELWRIYAASDASVSRKCSTLAHHGKSTILGDGDQT